MPTVRTFHSGLRATHQSNVMCTPSAVEIPWTIKAKRIGGGERLPIDGFNGRPGASVGRHGVENLSQRIDVGAALTMKRDLLFPNQMKGEDSQKSCKSFQNP